MAITSVNGTITRIFFDGKGAEVTESWQSKGETMSKRWSCFFDEPHGLNDGDVVSVSGMHADKIDEWQKDGETRRAVKRTLNKARLADRNVSVPSSPVEEPWNQTPPEDPWPTADVPF